VSRWRADHPYALDVNGNNLGEVDYEPAESRSGCLAATRIGAGRCGFRSIT
jgi:hypothetical protein